jgi:hypothetical protein
MTNQPHAITPCCFCSKLDYSGPDPTFMTVVTRSEVAKTWWCHVVCFEARLPDLPAPWNVYDYEEDTGRPFI